MNTEEREINLIDLCIYMAKGWRSMLIMLLLMAVVVTAAQYAGEVNALRAYQKAQELEASSKDLQETEETEEEKEEKRETILTLKQLREEMTEEEIKAIDNVVLMEKEYDKQENYLKKSALMTMDPYNISIARLQYWVDTGYQIDYAGVTKKDKTSDMVNVYVTKVRDSGWREKALEKADVDMKQAYFSELISVGGSGNSFTVTMKYSDEAKLRRMIAVLEKELDDYREEVAHIFGDHTLTLVNESVEVTVDNDIYALQQSRKNNLQTLWNSIVSAKNAFNDNQKSLYAGQIIVKEEEEEVVEEEPEEIEELEEVIAPPDPQIRVKNMLLGALLGIFLVCAFRAARYILSGRLKPEDDVEVSFQVTSLGHVEVQEAAGEAHGLPAKLDLWLDGLSRRSYRNLTRTQQLEMTVSNIALYCEKGKMKSIYVTSSANCPQELAGQLKGLLQERGIDVKEGFTILQDAGSLEAMIRTDGVVFLEQAEQSRYVDMQKEIQLCRKHEKKVIGMVIFV